MKTRIAALIAATLFTAAIPMVASAGEIRSVSVKTEGLDLTTAVGREALQRHVERAVSKVCGPNDNLSARAFQVFNACAADARMAASQQVEAAVAAANNGKNVASSSHTPAVR